MPTAGGISDMVELARTSDGSNLASTMGKSLYNILMLPDPLSSAVKGVLAIIVSGSATAATRLDLYNLYKLFNFGSGLTASVARAVVAYFDKSPATPAMASVVLDAFTGVNIDTDATAIASMLLTQGSSTPVTTLSQLMASLDSTQLIEPARISTICQKIIASYAVTTADSNGLSPQDRATGALAWLFRAFP